MKKRHFLLTIAAAVLSGCGEEVPLTLEELAAKRGAKLSQEEAVLLVKNYIRSSYKDPDSVKDLVIFDAQSDGYGSWVYCWEGNAKNSYGGYTGSKISGVYVRHGEVWSSVSEEFLYECGSVALHREPGLIKY